MDFPKRFSVHVYAFVFSMIFVFNVFFAGPAQAASLHTFKQFAAMTEQQKTEVVANASSIVFKDALTRKDNRQVDCLRKTMSLKYGVRKDVLFAHAILQRKIDNEIEIENKAIKPDTKKRVEYLIGNHLHQVCPPTFQKKVEFYYYGPPLRKVVAQPNLGVIDTSLDLTGS